VGDLLLQDLGPHTAHTGPTFDAIYDKPSRPPAVAASGSGSGGMVRPPHTQASAGNGNGHNGNGLYGGHVGKSSSRLSLAQPVVRGEGSNSNSNSNSRRALQLSFRTTGAGAGGSSRTLTATAATAAATATATTAGGAMSGGGVTLPLHHTVYSSDDEVTWEGVGVGGSSHSLIHPHTHPLSPSKPHINPMRSTSSRIQDTSQGLSSGGVTRSRDRSSGRMSMVPVPAPVDTSDSPRITTTTNPASPLAWQRQKGRKAASGIQSFVPVTEPSSPAPVLALPAAMSGGGVVLPTSPLFNSLFAGDDRDNNGNGGNTGVSATTTTAPTAPTTTTTTVGGNALTRTQIQKPLGPGPGPGQTSYRSTANTVSLGEAFRARRSARASARASSAATNNPDPSPNPTNPSPTIPSPGTRGTSGYNFFTNQTTPTGTGTGTPTGTLGLTPAPVPAPKSRPSLKKQHQSAR